MRCFELFYFFNCGKIVFCNNIEQFVNHCGKIVFSNNIEQFVFNCGKIVFSNNIEKFVFNCGKIVFRYISRCARCERCSKLKIKTPEFVKITIKLTIKTPLTSF